MGTISESTDMQAVEIWYETLDHIADDLHAIVRLLNNPAACMSAPEVLDAVRLAGQNLVSRTHGLAHRMRQDAATS